MSGVWELKDGKVRLLDKQSEPRRKAPAGEQLSSTAGPRRMLVHESSGQPVSSLEELEALLADLGWERDEDDGTALLKFYKPGSQPDPLTLSLPRDLADFTSVHMRDVVVKNRGSFHVVER
ncbi:hypothetical protein CFC21_090115 [Triticum aestivum]|uniref:Uncharacterized protein n=3 Tax=Triticum TaxID=4564 RepID=A0A9R1BFM1_TRITD|nr:hypothetical protein CFC21_090115 [Triticum aestivum]VAI62882.1 unnamed protein product [Triticum turgidum subsp. durum]